MNYSFRSDQLYVHQAKNKLECESLIEYEMNDPVGDLHHLFGVVEELFPK